MFTRKKNKQTKTEESMRQLETAKQNQVEVDKAEAELRREYGANRVAIRITRAVRGY